MKCLWLLIPLFILSVLSFPLINEFASLSEDLIPKELIFLIAFGPAWIAALFFSLEMNKNE